ncbi:MAG: inorganic pyrophosphatase [Clostridia bacterium]|nr:inorganic pyrophosphatase [Clostridia bacterium]
MDRIVTVIIDRPYGSVHPEHPDIVYPLNYGHVEGVMGGDGEEQDAYLLDFNMPELLYVGKEVSGYIVAVIRRKNDVETKWVVSAGSRKKYTREDIEKAVRFQEQYFDIEIIM